MLKRIKSVDFLRGLTVFSMIIYHFFVYWVQMKKDNYGPFVEFFYFFGYLAAPFFLIISGISYHIFIKKKIDAEQSNLKIFIEVLKRAVFIFIISTFLQIFFGFSLGMKIEFILYWSIFQVISFSMVLFYLIQFCKQSLRIIIHLILTIFLIYFEFIIKSYNLTFLYFLVEGTFEFVPWASFFLFGLIFGELILSFSNDNLNRKLISLIILGISCLLYIVIWMNYYWFYYFVPYFFPNFILMIGIFCILSSISYYLLDMKNKNFYFQESIIRWGQLAFSIYYIHLGLIAVGVILFPVLLNEFYTNGFLPYFFLIILLIFFVVLEIFTKIWQKYNFIFGIEWIMNKIIGKSLIYERTREKLRDYNRNIDSN